MNHHLTPSQFAHRRLGLDPYEWNIEVLEAVGQGKKVCLRAANGSGKTTMVIAPLILWFLSQYPKGWIPCTSGSFRQIKGQLWPSVMRFAHLFPQFTFTDLSIRTALGGGLMAFSTDNGSRAEGWHPKESTSIDPVMWLVDEAKSVPDSIFEGIDRCTRSFQLYASSPGGSSGQFYRCFNSEREHFYPVRATSFQCPHIEAATPGKYESDVARYGIDSPIVRSMHFAEFTNIDDSVILSAESLRIALEHSDKIVPYQGRSTAFCDFAAGGDENVLAIKTGNRVALIDSWHDQNTTRAVRRFIQIFEEWHLSPGQIYGDNGGLGKVMIDLMHDHGWRINRVMNGDKANDSNYANRGSEIWFLGSREIQKNAFHLEGIDTETFNQLTQRRIDYAPRGRDSESLLMAERKVDMKSRGISSPDRADAIMGCIACSVNHHTDAISRTQADAVEVPHNAFRTKLEQF